MGKSQRVGRREIRHEESGKKNKGERRDKLIGGMWQKQQEKQKMGEEDTEEYI